MTLFVSLSFTSLKVESGLGFTCSLEHGHPPTHCTHGSVFASNTQSSRNGCIQLKTDFYEVTYRKRNFKKNAHPLISQGKAHIASMAANVHTHPSLGAHTTHDCSPSKAQKSHFLTMVRCLSIFFSKHKKKFIVVILVSS